MAAAYLKHFAGADFFVESGGIEPGKLNPNAVEAMRLDGIDISGNKTHSVMDYYAEGRKYDYVIAVCDESNASKCPIFPGEHIKLQWHFDDPGSFTGSREEKLQKTLLVRDKIKKAIQDFIAEINK
jgi:arsenate reductase